MKQGIKRFMIAFMITLPLTFSMVFFGYLHPQFDVVVYTDNIRGEGTCSAYLSSTSEPFAYLYKADAYFGSELKTLRMQNLRYNVNAISLYLYGIEEADILSYDIAVFGFTVLHHNSNGDQIVFKVMTQDAVVSEETSIAHIENEKPDGTFEVDFVKSIGIPAWVWIAYFCLILLIATVSAFGLSFIIRRFPRITVSLLGLSGIMLTMTMGCFLCGSLPYVNYTDFLLNWLLLVAVTLLINSLTLPWIGTVLVSAFTLVWYIANHYVIQFRSKPIMPADLKAINTAKEVAGGYDLTPSWQIIVSVFVILLFTVIVILSWRKTKQQEKDPLKRQVAVRGIGAVAAVVLMYFSINNPAFSQLNTFQWDAKVLEGFHREGIVLTFVKSAISAHVDKPDGYSREIVDSYLADYQSDGKSDSVQPTRVIMIMNEAFSDLRTVGMDVSIDVMPFIDSLDKNTIEGSLFVSVIGGGTCNTEFEALTGNTLAFLGAGAYPYTENVTEPLFSLASYFGDEGYVTEAFHANEPQNWNRNIVYPNLGFGAFHSINDYPSLSEKSFLHHYITDATDYSFIEQRDKENEEAPRFLFNVTIQNHADYDHFEDVEETETLRPYDGTLHQNARVYLSLLKVSDDSIRDLVEQYRDSDEPTMIVFFGDHQPMLPAAAQSDVYTGVDYYLDYFKSKFFIWTNYETETAHDAAISANFLPWLILERGNFPLPPYVQMLKEVHEKYPIISSQGVIDAEGNVYDNVAVLLDDPLIQKYQHIQYANLFDELDKAWFTIG